MMVMVVLAVPVVMMVAFAFEVVALVLVVMMMVVMLVFVLIVIVVMVVVVMAAALAVLVLVVVVMVMLMPVLILILVVMVMVALARGIVALVTVMVVVMVVMVRGLGFQSLERALQRVGALDCLQNLLAVELVPGGRDNDGLGVALPQQGQGGFQLFGADAAGAAEHDGPRVADLVVVEFAEVLDVQLALRRVADRHRRVHVHALHALHRADDVAQLADAAGLDQDAVGVVGFHDLVQRLGEIAHQGAADAAAVELVHLDARLGHEAAVDADLAEFVLDQHKLLAHVGLGNPLFDQRGLARAQEAGKKVYFRHK